MNVGEILVWLPTTENEDFIVRRGFPVGNIGQRLHYEASSGGDTRLFDIDDFPTHALILQIKSLDGFQSLTLSGSKLVELIDETLEGVEVPFVARNIGSWISAFEIHVRHLMPSLVEDVELFALVYHEFALVGTTQNIDEPVLEIIMRGEGSPTIGNGRQFLDRHVGKMELEDVTNRPVLRSIYVASRNDDYFLVWNVNSTSKLQLLVQSALSHILDILGGEAPPPLVGLGSALCLETQVVHVPVEDEATGVVVQLILLLGMLSVSNADGAHEIRDYYIVEALRQDLQARLISGIHKLKNLVKYVL